MADFRFKEFTIRQEQSAMKVGTDGVILGAWVNVKNKKRALDIGSGTGLLSLMMAQRNHSLQICALEVDPDSFHEGRYNISQSKFKDQIETLHLDFNEFNSAKKFDIIVCNPPFHYGKSKSGFGSRDLARHGMTLWTNWIEKIVELLTENGHFTVIYPSEYSEVVNNSIENCGLFLNTRLQVKPTKEKPVHRFIDVYSKTKTEVNFLTMIIEENGRLDYSEDYKNLLSSYLTIF